MVVFVDLPLRRPTLWNGSQRMQLQPTQPLDRWRRPLVSLRLSVTDRCNLRCSYCMPEPEYTWLPRGNLLSFEEISRLVDVFITLGVTKVRLTGGEPLLRRDLAQLVTQLARRPALQDIALTTNGLLLAENAEALRAAGLDRVTVSLDTLRADRFTALTQRASLNQVLTALETTTHAGFTQTKIDSVILRDFNDDELIELIEFGKHHAAEVRFIEYMDVGGATRWSAARVFPKSAMLDRLHQHYGNIEPLAEAAWAPARRYRLADGTTFGIIASTTEPFCDTCDRSRLTADGMWVLCLYASSGIDLRGPLRAGSTTTELATRIRQGWEARTDRGAVGRLELGNRAPLVSSEALRANPHLEMHTRGG